MVQTIVPLPKQSNPQVERELGSERLVNGFAEVTGESTYTVRSVPGWTEFCGIEDDSNCRGWIMAGDYLFAVFDSGTYKIDSAGSSTKIGYISGTGRVFMAVNAADPQQIGVVTAEGRYYIIESDSIEPIDVSDIGLPNSIAWIAGYFVLGFPDGSFINTGINDGRSINGVDIAKAEGSPDGLVRLVTHALELWLFGTETIEVWALSADPPASGSPFYRVGGAVLPVGCGAAHSVAMADNSLFWVGDDGIVYRSVNYAPKRVSTHAVERAIRKDADRASIIGNVKVMDGHTFYELSGISFTWVLNLATGLWAEEQSYRSERSNADLFITAWGKTLVATKVDGNIYELDFDSFSQNGQPLTFMMQTVPVGKEKQALINGLEIDMVTGRAAASGSTPETNPVLEVSWSDDGGARWTSPRQLSVGGIGQYVTRVRTLRCGRTGLKWGRVFRFVMTDPVVRAVSLFRVDAEHTA